jgi:hypothetical protein
MKKIILFLLVVMCFSLTSCKLTEKEKEYYRHKENYIEATGTVINVKYVRDSTVLYLGFSDLSRKFDGVDFEVVGGNASILKSNNVEIELGDKLTFMTAPEYFGDGYIMPIVALWKDDECLLDFETGFSNFQSYLKTQ